MSLSSAPLSTHRGLLGTRPRLPVPTKAERRALHIVEGMRPPPLRDYDQIPMRSPDLLRQVKTMAPLLANLTVAFMGDYDGTSALLGLLASRDMPCPARMVVLDFDERLLYQMEAIARQHGFSDRLELRLYNAFDPVPPALVSACDWFYTNPPYGCRNVGESTRLFITRGIELTRSPSGYGCIIVPCGDTPERAWAQDALLATQRFLLASGWVVSGADAGLHRYQLDDDPDLPSSTLLVESIDASAAPRYIGRAVEPTAIPHFYGRSINPPYPRYVHVNGALDFEWPADPLKGWG